MLRECSGSSTAAPVQGVSSLYIACCVAELCSCCLVKTMCSADVQALWRLARSRDNNAAYDALVIVQLQARGAHLGRLLAKLLVRRCQIRRP